MFYYDDDYCYYDDYDDDDNDDDNDATVMIMNSDCSSLVNLFMYKQYAYPKLLRRN